MDIQPDDVDPDDGPESNIFAFSVQAAGEHVVSDFEEGDGIEISGFWDNLNFSSDGDDVVITAGGYVGDDAFSVRVENAELDEVRDNTRFVDLS